MENKEKWLIRFEDKGEIGNEFSFIVERGKFTPSHFHQFDENVRTGFGCPTINHPFQVEYPNRYITISVDQLKSICIEQIQSNQNNSIIPIISKERLQLVESPNKFTLNGKQTLAIRMRVKTYSETIFNQYEHYFQFTHPSFPKLYGRCLINEEIMLLVERSYGKTIESIFSNDSNDSSMINSFESYRHIIIYKIIEAVEDVNKNKRTICFFSPNLITISHNFDVFFNGIYEEELVPTVYHSKESLMETGKNNDLWSLGCLLYFIYTGKHPYDNNLILAKECVKNNQSFYSLCEDKNSKLLEIIKRCCGFNKEDTFPSVQALKIYYIISYQNLYQNNFTGIVSKKESN